MKISSFLKYLILFIFIIFLYLPISKIFIESFYDNDEFTFKWYYLLFKRKDIISSLFNSIFTSFLSVFIALIISLSGIFYIFLGGNKKLLSIVAINIIIPEIVFAMALMLFFSYFSIPLGKFSLITTYTTLAIGYIFPLIYQRWNDLDYSLINAAYDLGGTSKKIWKTIILPLITPMILVSSFLAMILLFDDYIISYFCGSSNFIMITMPILSMLRTGIIPEIKALSVLLMIFSFFIGLFYFIYAGFPSDNEEYDEI